MEKTTTADQILEDLRNNKIDFSRDHLTWLTGFLMADIKGGKAVWELLASPDMMHRFAAVIDPTEYFDLGKKILDHGNPAIIYPYVDIFRSSAFLTRIYDDRRWDDLIVQMLERSNYTFPVLFGQRAVKYADRIIFSVLQPDGMINFTWKQTRTVVETYARGLFALQTDPQKPEAVGFLCKNSIDMVFMDLACLTGGITNIMIPVNSVPLHIEYILKKTEPAVVVVSDKEEYDRLKPIAEQLGFLKYIIQLSGKKGADPKLLSPADLKKWAEKLPADMVREHAGSIKWKDLATVMFTSGTTGNPKGIMFSHQNIVYKRFARAMALPEIGEKDIFLAYLPLFHTFGRWLEMTGSIFWAARYIFMENPSAEIMVENMRRVKPSVFISIPKKWYQLYERIAQEIDLVQATNEAIRHTTESVTGGNLKWGLSAAGHLDAEIFEFFQRNGVELMSGFGMTEATGGITMTPPGKYRPNSLGKALPGIELKLQDDGELVIRGPYVMTGYINPEESDAEIVNSWFPTGDIMEQDNDGFIKIVDRKKEIYKNIKGETIAPQKIENYFLEFDFVKSVFLVGDHRPYNTLLIFPNYESGDIRFTEMDPSQIHNYFSSVVVSVNQFLAPYERVVDFNLIDRDFDLEHKEITPKGTFRRRAIEQNFVAFIEPMYGRDYFSIKIQRSDIRIPNWFLREKGITPNELSYREGRLKVSHSEDILGLDVNNDLLKLGDFIYRIGSQRIDFGEILQSPSLWLGNQELVNFTGKNITQWFRKDDASTGIYVEMPKGGPSKTSITAADLKNEGRGLMGLHMAAILMGSPDPDDQHAALEFIKEIVRLKHSDFNQVATELLRRITWIDTPEMQLDAFASLLEHIPPSEFGNFVEQILGSGAFPLNEEVIVLINDQKLSEAQLGELFLLACKLCRSGNDACSFIFTLLARYGSDHPTRFKVIRQFLVNCQLCERESPTKKAAQKAIGNLVNGFRQWLGSTQPVAVDPETGEEYQWEDVVIYEDGIHEEDRQRLDNAIQNTTMIREAVFLMSKGTLIRLNDIPPGGIWISLLGIEYGKAVYRCTVQTRFQGGFDIAINLNRNLPKDEIRSEINWLIQSGTTAGGEKLVEDFGGYWPEDDLWSEEFISGETARKFIFRISKQKDEAQIDRCRQLWPFFIWSGVEICVKFWLRTGRSMELMDPSPNNIIIPLHDYQTGTRIVSIASRRVHLSPLDMLLNLIEKYIFRTEESFEFLRVKDNRIHVFSALMEALGQKEGIAFLEECIEELAKKKGSRNLNDLRDLLVKYHDTVFEKGFMPRRLYFAIERFRRWFALNQEATFQAQAATLAELYDTYNLMELEEQVPETRTRFFVNTVFERSRADFRDKLENIIKGQRDGSIRGMQQLGRYVSSLQTDLNPESEELFFLTRLSFPHLTPTDSAALISLESGGMVQTDLVVQLADYDGGIYSVRSPVNPKEITRLHQLFLANNLPVEFRPEHHYLVAINDRNQLIGGVFYRSIDNQTVHIEKIVVTSYYRKKGVSDGILNEFFKRAHNDHYKFVTTGFFRPEYFYRFGFKIERKYAGLVKVLD